MARLNIEERCFGHSNLRLLSKLMGWSRREALGCLALLWHDSQEMLKTECTDRDIEVWCECKDEAEALKLVSALLESGWLSVDGKGQYYIEGSAKQVTAVRSVKRRAKLGGDATKKKWEKRKTKEFHRDNEGLNEGLRPSLGYAKTRPKAEAIARPKAEPNAIQCNTMQYNAIQGNAIQCNTTHNVNTSLDSGQMDSKSLDPGSVEPVSPDQILPISEKVQEKKLTSSEVIQPTPFQQACLRVWNAYKKAHLQRYKVEPVRNAQINSQIKNFVQRIGQTEAEQIVEFYVMHNDAFYSRNKHGFGFCLRDCEKLRTEMLTGQKTNWHQAKQAERTDAVKDRIDRIERGEL